MLHRPLHRLAAALFVAMSLLFAQLAMASYACPVAAKPAAMAGMMMATGAACAGMDAAQPALCHRQAASAPQSFDAAKSPAPSPPMVIQVLRPPLVLDAAEAFAIPPAGTPEARPPPAPVFLSTLRLRV
jgi:hypothetical protein